jgi:cell division protease FtsH
MVTEYGMSELGPIQYESNTGSVFLGRDYNSTQKNFSTQIAFEIDTEVRKIIDNAHEEARKILTKYKDQVILIAKTLLDKETITSEEIQSLIQKPVTTEEKPTAKSVVKKPRSKKEPKGDA